MKDGAVLVTGGAGYIGSHFVALLIDSGIPVVVLDDLSRGNKESVPPERLIVGSVQDSDLVSQTCARYNVDIAVHFAGLAYVGESVRDPALYYKNNVSNGVALLEALRASNVSSIVFSSSCATYGIPTDRGPIAEDDPQRPINPYGMSKLIFELILDDYDKAYNFRSIALRYFNATGASEQHALFEAHAPETHIIPLALEASHSGSLLALNGSDYDTRDGTCERDYVHVDDLASAHLTAVNRLRAGSASRKINLGLGRGYTLLEIVAAVEAETKKPLYYEFTSRRDGDPPSLVADPRKAQAELDWSPRYNNLEKLIHTANIGYQRRKAHAATVSG